MVTQAQNLVTEVYNNTGATLTKGTVVYINGGQGNLPTVTKAQANSDATSAQTYGVVRTDITNMNNGYITVIGNLDNIDTQAYSAGTQLYLSGTTAGAWTDVKPYAPIHLVYVGIVVRSHPTQGVVEIRIQNGYEMDELHNVSAQNPNNGDILQYVSSTSLWTKTAGTTTNIAEGTNLYYTQARFDSAFGAKTTSNLTEGTNLYYTDTRSRGAISLTTTGNNGASTYNSTTGVLNVPTYTLAGLGGINLTSLSATSPLLYDNTTGVFSIQQSSGSQAGFLSAADWTTFNNKQAALTNPVTGTGTTNYLPKFTASGTIGNSLIFDNGTIVGIGTSIPSLAAGIGLSIYNSSGQTRIALKNNTTGDGANDGFQIAISGDEAILDQRENSPLRFTTNAIERLRISAGGNISVGNTNDTYKLDVTGTIRATGSIFGDVGFRTKSLNGYLLKNDADSTNLGGLVRRSYWAGGAALDTQIFAETGYGIFLNVNGSSSTGMVINSTGNVGIGTSSPAEGTQAAGSISIIPVSSVASAPLIQFPGNGRIRPASTGDRLSIDGNALFLNSTFGGNIIMATGGGNVLIGTTSVNLARLNVVAATASQGIRVEADASYNAIVIGGNGNFAIDFPGIANGRFLVDNSGNTYNRTGVYGTVSSDLRLKENIVEASSKLDDILKLRVVNFNLISDTEKKKNIGFIAQELQEVFPSLVYEADTRQYDEDGNVISGLEDALGIKVGMEFAILVKAIQEQNQLITELSAKVTALENK